MPVELSLVKALDELFRRQRPVSFVICVREKICADRVCVFDGDKTMVFVKSELRSEGIFPSTDGYDMAIMFSELRDLNSVCCVSKNLC